MDGQSPTFTYIDPKGDTALKLLAKIRNDLNRLERAGIDVEPLQRKIHYFDLSSDRYVLGLNLLHLGEGEKQEEIVNNAVDLLINTYQSESMWLDKWARMALHALVLDPGRHSILGIEQMVKKDPVFRNRILPHLKGTPYAVDWADQQVIKQGHETRPVLNRMQKIRQNERMRRLFGHYRMDVQPARWMDDSHVCIFNVSGLSEEERRLAVGFIVSRYHVEARKRKQKSKIHLHLVDELSLIQLPIIPRIYAHDRYTGHCFVPMTQHVDQIQSSIRNAVDGNAATLIACHQGAKSAATMSEMSAQHLKQQEIQALPKLTACLSTRDAQGVRVHFRVRIPPPYLLDEIGKPTYFGADQKRQQTEEYKAMQAARRFGETLMERDCVAAEKVDEWINQYVNPQDRSDPEQSGDLPIF